MTSANPYRIEGPALISFSGGRTSGFMLKQILDAWDGTLPDDVFVCFANTGKEREETLRFVHECATRWKVRVRWLEFLTDLKRGVPIADRFEEVGYNSASRNGEPLTRLINRKKALFSTLKGRWCTEETKVRVLHNFMASVGFKSGEYAEIIGFRADEYDRVVELPAKPHNRNRRLLFPLNEAQIRKPDVDAYWKRQDFDLNLPRGTGNCDHCPFVSRKARIARMRIDPTGADWWLQHEAERKFKFGWESFADIVRDVEQSPVFPTDLEMDAAETECVGWCGK